MNLRTDTAPDFLQTLLCLVCQVECGLQYITIVTILIQANAEKNLLDHHISHTMCVGCMPIANSAVNTAQVPVK